jgi:hypothetical protein
MDDRRTFLANASILPAVLVATAARALPAQTSSVNDETKPIPAPSSAPLTPPGAGAAGDQMPYINDPEAPQALPMSPDKIGSKTRQHLLDDHNPVNWRDSKHQLGIALQAVDASDPVIAWLKTFDESFDALSTRAVIAGAATIGRPGSKLELRYEPQLFEAWLKSASALLDRCLEYRREMGGFEIAGVKAAFEYLSFLHTNPLQRHLMKLGNQADVADIQQRSQNNAAHKYAEAIALEKVARGHALESDGASKAAGLTKAKEQLRTEIQAQQFDINTETQLAQFTRFLTAGSSSNYAERYLRLQMMLMEDLADAYCKLYCAAQGVIAVLGLKSIAISGKPSVDVAIPAFVGATAQAAVAKWVASVVPDQGAQRSPDVVDALVLWTRAMLRELERSAQYESEVTVSIPLTQPCGSRTAPILTTAQVTTAFGGTTAKTNSISFTLAADALPFSATLDRLRVIGVGVSVVHDIADAVPVEYSPAFPVVTNIAQAGAVQASQVGAAESFVTPKLVRLNGMVTSPPQVLASGANYKRPPILLPNVRIQGGFSGDTECALSGDSACRNLNPLGTWSIALDRNAIAWYGATAGAAATCNWVTGLILHLRIRTLAS